jgi:hypothetical protein
MNEQWIEVVKLTFKGKRFEGHALDADALEEISQYLKIVQETAKAQWRVENPGKNLIRGFDDQVKLYLRDICDGSAGPTLYARPFGEPGLFEGQPHPAIVKSVETTGQAFTALEHGEPFPESLPKSLLQELEKLGQKLQDGESLEINQPQKKPARITTQIRARWQQFVESKYEGYVDITGEVLEADVRRGKFQIWKDGKGVEISFTPNQEDVVVEALKQHDSRRLRVMGKGEHEPGSGTLKAIKVVECLELQSIGDIPYDETARPIEEILIELANEIPAEEWKKLPEDLTDNLDHYLYGGPKR